MKDDMTIDTVTGEGEGAVVVPELDEKAFLKKAKRRSVRRTVFVACAVVLVAGVAFVALGWGWSIAIGGQAQRIDDYYLEYVKMTYPNTEIMPGDTLVHFPGASRHFVAFRRVGDVAVPAGEAVVQFNVLGSGFDHGPVRQIATTVDGRNFGGSSVTPQLEFIEPPLGGGQLSEMMSANADKPDASADTIFLAQFAAAREKSIKRLAAAPPSATVEMAVSFADVMTLQQVEDLVGPDLRLAWAAVRVRDAGEAWWWEIPGSGFGVFFDQSVEADRADAELHKEQEKDFVPKLRAWVANGAPWLTARRCRHAADYLEKNGFRYYGVVVTGSPAAELALTRKPEVTAVNVGAVVAPWD
jgi:hypothetical protein